MIYIDISEKEYVHKAFKKRFGDFYKKKELGSWDCSERKIPFLTSEDNLKCLTEKYKAVINTLMDYMGYKYNKNSCSECPQREYVRFADIEIGEGRAFYERKTPNDFASSMKDRLYRQMNAMDTFIRDGHKGIILEGKTYLEDSFWSEIEKDQNKHRAMSPLQQAIEASGGKKGWVLSFIKECKMRGIEFVQTYNLYETIDFIEQCEKGFGNKPEFRLIPKRYPTIPIEVSLLAVFKGVGKVRAKKILKENIMVAGIITALKNAMEKYKFVKEKKK